MDHLAKCQQDLSQLEYFRISNMVNSNNLAYLKKYPIISIRTKMELVMNTFNKWNQQFHDEQLEQCFVDFNIDKNVYDEIKKGKCGIDDNDIVISNDVKLDLDIFKIINKSFNLNQEIIFVNKYDLLTDEEKNTIIASKYYAFQIDAIKLQQSQVSDDIINTILDKIDFQPENLFNFALVNKNFNDKVKNIYVELKKGQICNDCNGGVFKRSLKLKCVPCKSSRVNTETVRTIYEFGQIITCNTCPNKISIMGKTDFYKDKCGPCLGQKIHGTFNGKFKEFTSCDECKVMYWVEKNRIHNFCPGCFVTHQNDNLGPKLGEWSRCLKCESFYFASYMFYTHRFGRCFKC